MSSSGQRSRSPRERYVFIRAISILVEARGEVEQAEVYMATLPGENAKPELEALMSGIKGYLTLAYRSTKLSELERLVGQAERLIHECVTHLEQANIPPTTEWHHQRQLAVDWLACSVGRLKVALTYARLEVFQKNQPAAGLEN